MGLVADHHIVQVVGDQPGQRIGLHDDRPLAIGETGSVEVEVREALSTPALASGEGVASGSGSGPVLPIVAAAAGGVVALALVVILLLSGRRRRDT